MRKSADTVEEQRNQIKRTYKRGRKTERKITSETSLTQFEREVKREVACYLKAQDFSYNYIGDTLGLSREVVKKWFLEDDMRTKVTKIQEDFIAGAVKLMKTYAIEIVEIFMEIVRTSPDEKIVIQAGIELLDRMGLAKVNKSESAVTKVESVDITDKTGLIARAQNAPPEAQAAMAAHLEAALAVASEHAEPEVADAG